MGREFARRAFTPAVTAIQARQGSRDAYVRMAEQGADDRSFGPDEADFVSQRDHFTLASTGETGWPYVQHRGGPVGFVRVLDPQTIGFADYRGNRQYITVGNISRDPRVAMLFIDYPSRSRLKVLGRARAVEDEAVLARLIVEGYPAKVERGVVIDIEAFDWNCPQHITPRFTLSEIEHATTPLRERIAALEAELAQRQG